nr:sugar kinase [Propionicimonas sp.]
MTPPKLVGFGEVLLRLNPPGHQRLLGATSFEAHYTGAEGNVAVMLAQLGLAAEVVTRLPGHDVGQAAVNSLRHWGVGTSHIARGGDRIGIMYLETGAAQRGARVLYDRTGTSFQSAARHDFDWDAILGEATWLHFSGTAPALGPGVRDILDDALTVANGLGVTVSCDLNYRASLWSEAEAQRTMPALIERVNVLFGNEEDAARALGVRAGRSDWSQGTLDRPAYEEVATTLADRYGLTHVSTSLRRSISASVNEWGGMLFDGSGHHYSRTYLIDPIVDRVGGGDSFAAGIIYGLMTGLSSDDTVEYAAAASCLKHSIPGDLNLIHKADIESLLSTGGTGRVDR